jgi:secreted Zn-dependent insulinase-like peptidase
MKQTAIQQAIVMVRSRIETIDETLMGKHTIHHLQQIERGLYDLLEKEREMKTTEEIVNEMMEQTDEMLVKIHKNLSEKIGEKSADEWVEMLKKVREKEIERQTK